MRPDLAVAAVPLLLAVLLPLILPGYYRPLFDDRISILGLPAGEALLIPGAMLAALGVFGARRGGLREPRGQMIALTALLSPLLVLLVVEIPWLWCYAIGIALVVAVRRPKSPALVFSGAFAPLLVLVVVGQVGAAVLLIYVLVATLLVLAARFRWLAYAFMAPLVLVLLYGPSVIRLLLDRPV